MKYIKIGLIFGALCGVAAFSWFLGVYYFKTDPFYSFGQKLVILIQLAFAFLSIRYYKKKKDGILYFGEGLIIGMTVTVVSSVISSLLIFIFSNYIYNDMVRDHVDILYKYMIGNKEVLIKQSSKEIYEGSYESIKGVNAYTLALDDFIWKIVRGTMFSILVSIALRKKTPSNT